MAEPMQGVRRVRRELGVVARRLRAEWESRDARATQVEHALLAAIAEAGEVEPTVASVAARVGVDKSTASRQVAELERRGLVVREAIPGQRRAQRLVVTAEGQAVREQAARVWDAVVAERLAGWSPQEVRTFGELLVRYNEGR